MFAFRAFNQRALSALAGLLLGGIFAADAAMAETRIALVIGNSEYRSVTAIPNPINDSDSVTELLRTANFTVIKAQNLTHVAMQRAISDFTSRVANSGPDTVALVFYAGHGVQVDGQNYLVPVDARIERQSDLPLEAVRLTDLMNALRQVPASARIVILDACRNNPFAKLEGEIGRGLAIVDAPKGSIVAYSTAPGAVAKDGGGSNSPFTAALLDAARQPGTPIEQMFKKVRLAVNKTTDGTQTPWESTSLTSNFAFFPGDGSAPATASVEEPTTVVKWKETIRELSPEEAYERVVVADSVEGYEAFLALFEKAPLAPRVQVIYDRRVEMVMWLYANTVNTEAAFAAFLTRYPNSDMAPTAERLRERARDRDRALGALDNASQAFASANNAVPAVRVVTRTIERKVPVEVVRRVEVPKIVEKVVERRVEVPVEKVVVRRVEVPKYITKVVEKVVRVPVRFCPGGGGTGGSIGRHPKPSFPHPGQTPRRHRF